MGDIQEGNTYFLCEEIGGRRKAEGKRVRSANICGPDCNLDCGKLRKFFLLIAQINADKTLWSWPVRDKRLSDNNGVLLSRPVQDNRNDLIIIPLPVFLIEEDVWK